MKKYKRDTATHYKLMGELYEVQNQLQSLTIQLRKAIRNRDLDKIRTITSKLEKLY